MDLVVYDDDEKRYVPWAVALAAGVLVALVTAALTFVLARQASGGQEQAAVGGVTSPEPATAPSATPSGGAPAAGPTPAPACEAALMRADAAVQRGAALDQALARHTEIVDDLLAERIDAQEALDRALPVLTGAATERRRFEQEVTAFADARQDCPA